MIDLARPGEYLEILGARVQDAVTFVAYDEDGIWALQGLALMLLERPTVDLREIYSELDRFDRTVHLYSKIGKAVGERWTETVASAVSIVSSAEQDHPSFLAEPIAIALSLATAVELWRQETKRGQGGPEGRFAAPAAVAQHGQESDRRAGLLLAFTIALPGTHNSDKTRLVFAEHRSVLTLCPGSLIALWSAATTVVSAIGWAVSLVCGTAARVRSAEAAAHALVENLRNERAATDHAPLLRLDSARPEIPANPKAAMIFVHGLMSTDLGTFDGFINKWWKLGPAVCPPEIIKAVNEAVSLFGWPHDTLTSIDQNASDLARLIDMHLGNLLCPIAFVCHSRGGLVARATFEKLCAKNKTWESRVCLCITFGTPHAGVEIAEHPDRQLGAYVLSGLAQKQLSSLFDMAAYLRQRGKVEGIEDLRPANATNKPFLRELEELEWKNAPGGAKRRLPIYAIGGIVRLGDRPGPLLKRLGHLYDAYHAFYTGQTEYDLVVPFSSATAADDCHAEIKTTCDHFSYFSDASCAQIATEHAIRELWERFGLAQYVTSLQEQASKDEEERRKASLKKILERRSKFAPRPDDEKFA